MQRSKSRLITFYDCILLIERSIIITFNILSHLNVLLLILKLSTLIKTLNKSSLKIVLILITNYY